MPSPTPQTRTTTRFTLLLLETTTERYEAPESARPVITTTGEDVTERPGLAKSAPTVLVTGPRERTVDPSLRYSVRYYDRRAVRVLWTDSRELADSFAASHTVYAKPCRVEERETAGAA